jgi:hypothetical protein
MDPYTNSSYWTSVVSQINDELPGTVDGIHLQTYAGGRRQQSLLGAWDFGSVPVYPGVSDQPSAPPYRTPAQAKTAMQNLAFAMRHHRRLAVDFRSDRRHQRGAPVRARDQQRRGRLDPMI